MHDQIKSKATVTWHTKNHSYVSIENKQSFGVQHPDLVDWQWNSNTHRLTMNIRYNLIPAHPVFFGCDETSFCLSMRRYNSQKTSDFYFFLYLSMINAPIVSFFVVLILHVINCISLFHLTPLKKASQYIFQNLLQVSQMWTKTTSLLFQCW